MPTVIELPDLKPLIRRLKDNCDDINDEFESYNVLLSRELKIKLVNDLNKKSSEGNKNKKYKAEIDGDYVKFQMEDGIVGTEPFLSFIMVAHAIELKKTYKVYLEQAYKVKEGLKSEFSEKDFETVGGENNLDSKLKKRIKEEIGGLGALSENSKILLIKFMTANKEKRIDEFGNYKGLYRSDTLDPVFSSAMNILVQRFTYVEKMFDVIDQDLEVELKNLKLSGFGKLVLGREDLDLNEFAFLSFKELMKKFTIEQLLDESSTTKCTQWGKYNLINLTVGAENSGEKYTLQNLIGLYASEDIDKNNKHLYSGDKIRFQKDKLDSVYFGSSLFSYYFSSEWGHDYPNKLNFKNFKAYVEKVSKGRYKLDCYLKDSSKPKDFTYLLIDLGVQNHPLNQILYGPPGSGKTYNAVNHALSIALKKDLKSLIESQKGNDRQRKSDKKDFDGLLKDGQIRFVTFHQSYSYEDFVEGIKPRVVKNNIEYHVEPGVFKQICEDASAPSNSEKNYVLIIDEINRGNISKIFGELITLIEDSKRIGNPEELSINLVYSRTKAVTAAGEPATADPMNLLPKTPAKFGVPNNVYIIGTMNTADKSIALVDLALRRRFTFIEYPADPTLLETTADGINLKEMLTLINKRIEFLLDKEHAIGHSYLMGKQNTEGVLKVFENKIIPLLCEYFHNDFKKICWVLGDHEKWKENENDRLVRKKEVTPKIIFGCSMEDEFEGKENEMYELNPKYNQLTEHSLKAIYLNKGQLGTSPSGTPAPGTGTGTGTAGTPAPAPNAIVLE